MFPTVFRDRPAVMPAACFLAGLALSNRAELSNGAAGAIVAALFLLAVTLRRRVPVAAMVSLCLALACLAILHGGQRRAAREAVLASVLPADQDSVDLHFVGVVKSVPEIDWSGEGWLQLRGVPEGAARDPDGLMNVLLRIRAREERPSTGLRNLAAGDVVRVWCRLRRPGPLPVPGDRAIEHGLRPGIDAVGRVKSARLVERLACTTSFPSIDRVRRGLGARLDDLLGDSEDERALVGAMLVGERRGIRPEMRRRLRDAGLLHLVAISGLHVGILVGLLLALLARTPLGARPRMLFAVPLLALFAQGVGARPPVVRAACGAGLLLIGRSIGREGDPFNTLMLLAALLAAHEPVYVTAPGFQLTFLATIGIVLWSAPIARAMPLPAPVATALAVSAAAYLATAPAVAWHFRWLAPIGLVSNLLAIPLCTVVLASGYTAVLLADLPWIGDVLRALTSAAARGLIAVAGAAEAWPEGAFCVARPAPLVILVYYGLLILLRGGLPRRWARSAARGAWLLLVVWLHLGPAPASGTGHPEVAMLDVGQGQAIAVSGPVEGTLLVDSGGSYEPRFDPGERIVLPHLVARGVRRIEALILTHGHADHAGGAFALLRELEIAQLWIPPGAQHEPLLRAIRGLAHARGTAVVVAEAGSSAVIAGLPLQVLAPPRSSSGAVPNERSMVVLIGERPVRLLLTGDIDATGERALIASGALLRAEAFSVPHHGSRHGTSEGFLEQVRPRWALLSAGRRNPFGHPHREVLDRLERHGATLLRTDLSGCVRLRSDPRGWRPARPVIPCRSARE